MRARRYRPFVATVAVVAVAALSACSSDGSTASTTTTRPGVAPLHILVTNDDGYAAPGIDTVTRALLQLPNVRVTVVAPATNQSGTGTRTSESVVRATPDPRTTAGGHAATVVLGYPADAVNYALDHMRLHPDVVVSGINQGQNLGPVASISGTVGAAKRAAARGIPAIAVSQGLAIFPQYQVSAALTVSWIHAHAAALLAHRATVGVVNLNVPTCTTGTLRGVMQVPLATTPDRATSRPNCASTVTAVATDVEAFRNGYAAVTQLSPAGTTVTPSTTFPFTPPTGQGST